MPKSRTALFVKATMLSLVAVVVVKAPAYAINSRGFAGGGQRCGSCAVPEGLEASAIALEKQFSLADRKTLLTEQFASSLCENHECGNLEETQAGLLLDRHFAEKDRIEDRDEKKNAIWFNWASLVIAAASFILGGMAYRHSIKADKRSVRNEDRISNLK